MNEPTPTRRQRIDTIVARVAVVLAVLGTLGAALAAVLIIRGSGDDTADTLPTTVPVTTLETTLPPTTSTTTSTTTTIPETTTTAAPETTAPPTTPEPTAAPTTTPSVAEVPTIPANPEYSGFGSHQVMDDPLPSGVSFAQVEGAWNTAKRLADLLPPEDWDAARQLLQVDPLSDEEFAARFGAMEKMSLMLLDAVPDGSGFQLRLGVVSNEPALGTTTVWCTLWYADENAVDVLEELRELGRYTLLFTPEHLRNNPADDANLRAACR